MFTEWLKSAGKIFRPPFVGLAAFIWAFFLFAFMVYPQSGFWQGGAHSAESYLFLTHTLDWIQHGNWYAPLLNRFAGVGAEPLYFSRLAEVPLVLLALPLHFFFSDVQAIMIASAILPLVYFAIFLITVRWVAQLFIEPNWQRVTSYIVLFSSAITFYFMPGQASAMAPEMIALMATLGCVIRFLQTPTKSKYALWAGALLALSFALQSDFFFIQALIVGWIGFWVLMNGHKVVRAANLCALSLMGASFFFLIITQPFGSLFVPNDVSYSITHVMLTLVLGLGLMAVATATYFFDYMMMRVVVGVLSIFCLIAGFGYYNPLWIGHVASSLMVGPHITILQFVGLVPALAALLAMDKLLRPVPSGGRTWLWGLFIMLQLVVIPLASVSAHKFLVYAQMLSIIPLTLMLQEGLVWIEENFKDRTLAVMELLLILFVGPLPMVLLPALFDGRPFNTGVLLFPVQSVQKGCDAHGLTEILDSGGLYGNQKHVVMAMPVMGGEIMLRTVQDVVAVSDARFNPAGYADTQRFFSTTDVSEAEKIIQANGVHLVALCRSQAYLYHDKKDSNESNVTMAGMLAADHPPEFMRKIDYPALGDVALFEVIKRRAVPVDDKADKVKDKNGKDKFLTPFEGE